MGIRLVAANRGDPVETVSTHDTAIDVEASDMEAFRKDRSDVSSLVIIEPPADKPWDGCAYFTLRALDDYELTVAARASGVEATAMANGLDNEVIFPYLHWVVRYSLTGWRNVWREPDAGEDGPQPAEFRARRAGERTAADPSAMRHLPSEVVADLAIVVLDISTVSEQEKKASGSPPATRLT